MIFLSNNYKDNTKLCSPLEVRPSNTNCAEPYISVYVTYMFFQCTFIANPPIYKRISWQVRQQQICGLKSETIVPEV